MRTTTTTIGSSSYVPLKMDSDISSLLLTFSRFSSRPLSSSSFQQNNHYPFMPPPPPPPPLQVIQPKTT